MNLKRYDQIGTLFWFIFALVICIESIKLPLGSLYDPGPGFFPLGSGIILGLLSGIAYLQSFLRKSQEVRNFFHSKGKWKNLILVLVALFGYAISLEILGFLISTFILLIFLFRGMRGAERQRWILTISGSALASLISYAIFELWLKARLPHGILGF
jgi:putative tricarboxylic transport membrane protein